MTQAETKTPTEWQPLAGELIADRFRLQHEVGRGGMASVWQALHVALDAPCAIKFINAAGAQSSDLVARFRREARAAAKLRSRHVVQIFDYGVWKQRPFIAMELLEGVSLGDQLEEQGLLTVHQVLTIAQGVGAALRLAKEFGVVHRDLKPENIFVVGEGGDLYVKVLDFGIAKVPEPEVSVKRTESGILLGTPFYMSPEQIDGTRPVDHRSDLWSLAVVIYECITGELPFDSSAFGNLALKILKGPIPVPSEACPDLPAAFDTWWVRAAARDPNKRFQSADALVAALDEALEGVEFAALRTSRVVLAPAHRGEERPPAIAETDPAAADVGRRTADNILHTSAVRPSPPAPDSDPPEESIGLAPTDPPPPRLQLNPPAAEPLNAEPLDAEFIEASADEQQAALVPLKSRTRLWLAAAAMLVLASLLWWRGTNAPAESTAEAEVVSPSATVAAAAAVAAAVETTPNTPIATVVVPIPSTAATAPPKDATIATTAKPPVRAVPTTTAPVDVTRDYPDPGY